MRINKNSSSFLVALCALSFVSSTMIAQQEDGALYTSLARVLKTELPPGLILAETMHYMSRAKKPLSDAAREALSRELGVEMTNEESVSCPGVPSTCRLRRGVAVVALAEPVLVKDTAKVRVHFAGKSESRRQPVHQALVLFTLVRGSSGWQLVERKVLWTT